MLRRDLLRLLGGVSALAAIPTEDLFALGESTHAGLRANTAGLGFFDAHQLQTVAAAADRIIPTTETPGAREADCHRFAEKIIADHYDTTRQKRFITGLVDLDSRSSTLAQKLFVDLTPQQQDSVLAGVEKETLASTTPAASFWRDLKYLTIYGYYTSRIGIQDELEVNFYPGRFDGCAPLEAK
ncbi:MAG: gluconate 2-dehydrogenase subunit 3 family protein [Vicinamibacteria bacterium]|nr:gluconate 2-dehydrogenase subunit 3 family protein [Vicinamibacteria bacterium]